MLLPYWTSLLIPSGKEAVYFLPLESIRISALYSVTIFLISISKTCLLSYPNFLYSPEGRVFTSTFKTFILSGFLVFSKR